MKKESKKIKKKEKSKKAEKLISKIHSFRKDKARELFESGMRLFKLEQFEASLKDLKKAFHINPKSSKSITKEEIAYSIAKVYCDMNDISMELKYYGVSVRQNPRYYDSWFDKGMKYLYLSRNKIFNLENPLRGRWGKKLLDEKSLHKEALYCFRHAAKVEPTNPEAHYYIGYVCEVLKDAKNAVKMFDKVLEINTNYKNIERSYLFDRVRNEEK